MMLETLLRVLPLVVLLFPVSISKEVTLHCVNDFERKMTCDFKLMKNMTCAGYSLKVEFNSTNVYLRREYRCAMKTANGIKCSCEIDMEDKGFLSGEKSFATLSKFGVQQGQPQNIPTWETIKPKPPTITYVQNHSAGETMVKWHSNYNHFPVELRAEICVRKKDNGTCLVFERDAGTTHYMKHLESNTEYLVKARTYGNNLTHSEWSEEVRFRTGEDITLIILLCVIIAPSLLICILVYCTIRLKKGLEKDFPKMGPIDHFSLKEYKVYLPEKIQTSKLEGFNSKKCISDEEKSMLSVSTGSSSGPCSLGDSSGSNLTQVDYGQTCHETKEEEEGDKQNLERFNLALQLDVERLRLLQPHQMTMPDISAYESTDVLCSKGPHGTTSAPQCSLGCSSGSSFDNKCYSVPTSPITCEPSPSFFAPPVITDLLYKVSEDIKPLNSETAVAKDLCTQLGMLVETELSYRSCDGHAVGEMVGCPLQFSFNPKIPINSSENLKNRSGVVQGSETGRDPTWHCSTLEENDNCPAPPFGVCSQHLSLPNQLACGPLVLEDEYRSLPSLVKS